MLFINHSRLTSSPLPCPGFIPVCSLGSSQVARINLGQNVSTLRYFAICGLQEGFEPFAINMKRDITMWFSKSLPQFVPVPTDHAHIEVRRGALHTASLVILILPSSYCKTNFNGDLCALKVKGGLIWQKLACIDGSRMKM